MFPPASDAVPTGPVGVAGPYETVSDSAIWLGATSLAENAPQPVVLSFLSDSARHETESEPKPEQFEYVL